MRNPSGKVVVVTGDSGVLPDRLRGLAATTLAARQVRGDGTP